MRLPVNHALPLAALILLYGCGLGGGGQRPAPPPPAVSGPAADYPMVLGEPFAIDGTTYTPIDKLNYDAVGYAAVSSADDATIAAAHKTLPLPSYAEVTALDTGRTILVRIRDRGPMRGDTLVELSAGAAAQLGISAGASVPIRVRRVAPPEAERALLRGGQRAPERMETPPALRKVLMRKLGEGRPIAPAASVITTTNPDIAAAPLPPPVPVAAAAAPQADVPARAAQPAPRGAIMVQAGAFSTRERAESVARQLGASVSKPGRYWLVRLGPFRTAAQAQPALAKARAAGYSDARIQRAE